MIARKKPVEVEAYKLNQDNAKLLSDWCKGLLVERGDNFEKYIQIVTLDGIMTARSGDYIIKGVNGEFYPCSAEVFGKTYEVVKG
jgi:hypothetical protein